MKKRERKISLSAETLRHLDPQDLKDAAGDSVVTTTSQIQTCVSIVFAC
jgi:hypothetical protein